MSTDLIDDCPICEGQKWVCEGHTDTPWLVKDGSRSHCGAPGVPCESCNPCGGRDDPPDDMPGFIVKAKI